MRYSCGTRAIFTAYCLLRCGTILRDGSVAMRGCWDFIFLQMSGKFWGVAGDLVRVFVFYMLGSAKKRVFFSLQPTCRARERVHFFFVNGDH